MNEYKNIPESASPSNETKEPVFFFREYEQWGFFSQWYQAPFSYKGPEFPEHQIFNCAEQFFMWRKAVEFGDADSAERILRASSPEDQKAIGRGVTGFIGEKWDAGSCYRHAAL